MYRCTLQPSEYLILIPMHTSDKMWMLKSFIFNDRITFFLHCTLKGHLSCYFQQV